MIADEQKVGKSPNACRRSRVTPSRILPVAFDPIMLSYALLFTAALLAPQEPLRIGVVAKEDSPHKAFVRGAQRAADAINKAGGVGGSKIELVWRGATNPKEVAPALKELQAAGVHALVAPIEAHASTLVKKSLKGALPLLTYDAAGSDVAAVIDRLLAERLCMTRVGLITDQNRPAKAFGKLLATKGLALPTRLLWQLDIRSNKKKVDKQFEKERPEILICNAEPEAAQRFLDEMLADDPIPVILMPRAFGRGMLSQKRAVFAIHGLSPAQGANDSKFRREYELSNGIPGLGAAEGFEAVSALAMAFTNAGNREPAAVSKALESVAIEGIRGRFSYDKKLGAFDQPLGVWLLEEERMVPYAPRVVPLGKVGTEADAKPDELRKPDPTVGVPFGTWRTRQFKWEAGSQWVLLLWADDAGYATGDDDLKLLGLSTGGKQPLVDHLVREEIFARVMAITSSKWGRKEDGTAIQQKSLRICFGSHIDAKERKKKKQRLWPARFGGDHEGAGGEAFGTFCRVYTTFIRRTIFQPNALKPVVSASDREILDGTYTYGTDVDKDNRSNRLRALINAYAGSMALTLAHEVGHLASLGHVTGDPVEIMNVDEGAGLDYPEAKFGEGSWTILTERLGIVGEGTKKKRR